MKYWCVLKILMFLKNVQINDEDFWNGQSVQLINHNSTRSLIGAIKMPVEVN